MDFTPEERERFRLQRGDVVLAEASGSGAKVGRAALWNDEIDECCYQNTVIRFRPHATEPEYALLVFRHLANAGVFAGAARGLGIQHLGSRRFSSLDFQLPPADEQVRIVREARRRLAELTEAQAALRSASVRLEEQKREIYAAAAFGNLVEPGSGTSRHLAETKGRADALEIEHPTGRNSREPTARGQLSIRIPRPLPKKWSWSTVRDLGSVQLGITRSPKREVGGQPTRYLRSANIGKDGLNIRSTVRMEISSSERQRFDLRPGDILVAEASGSSSQVGRSAIWRGEIEGCSYQNHIIRFRSHVASPEYLDLVFKHYRYCGVFADRARGVGIQHLGARRFASIPVPVPPQTDQEQIAKEAKRRLELSQAQAEAIRMSLSRIEMMESEILAAAVTGELVRQRKDVESAMDLLYRMGGTRRKRPIGRPRKPGPVPEEKRVAKRSLNDAVSTLPEVLRKAGRPMALPDVFASAGYDRNSLAEVEAFYVALRQELGQSVRIVEGTENGLLELI